MGTGEEAQGCDDPADTSLELDCSETQDREWRKL